MSKNNSSVLQPIYGIIGVIVAMIGHTIHGSIFWAIINFFFWPFSVIVWLINKELTMTVIRETFSFFLQ